MHILPETEDRGITTGCREREKEISHQEGEDKLVVYEGRQYQDKTHVHLSPMLFQMTSQLRERERLREWKETSRVDQQPHINIRHLFL